ncbi:MAG: LysM peptidoglycan-binding domain-containing protein [Polyangiaceae bacterium]
MRRVIMSALLLGGILAFPSAVSAQKGPPAGGGTSTGPAVSLGTAPAAGTQSSSPAGGSSSGGGGSQLNTYLPSSAQPLRDVSRSSDGFDLGSSAGSAATLRGSPNAAYVVTGDERLPELHTVKRKDTFWRISLKYFGNAYQWPRIWSYNAHVQNPHWLYPGDQIRLRGHQGVTQTGDGVGFARRKRLVPRSTIFQRTLGFALDTSVPTWGTLLGSPDDQMLLSTQDEIYIKLNPPHRVRVGQLLTLFERRKVSNPTSLHFVWIRGIAKVNRYNKDTHMVRARIVEALDVVERGVFVGPMHRKMRAVTPTKNKKTISAKIIGALYPHQFYGQYTVVFIDKGKTDGVEVGNRFFAVSRGDLWRDGIRGAGALADVRPLIEEDGNAVVERTPDTDEPDLYPAETYAELTAVHVRSSVTTCVVNGAVREIGRGAVVVARKGY